MTGTERALGARGEDRDTVSLRSGGPAAPYGRKPTERDRLCDSWLTLLSEGYIHAARETPLRFRLSSCVAGCQSQRQGMGEFVGQFAIDSQRDGSGLGDGKRDVDGTRGQDPGSSPSAACVITSRIVAVAFTRTSSTSPPRTWRVVVSSGGTSVMSIVCVSFFVTLAPRRSFIPMTGTHKSSPPPIALLGRGGQRHRRHIPDGSPPHPAIAQRMAAIVANHGRMFRAGATIVPGTDAGVSPGKPHDVLPHALRALVERIGMTPPQALRAATSTAASAIGLKAAKGRIAVGADADVLVIRGTRSLASDRSHT